MGLSRCGVLWVVGLLALPAVPARANVTINHRYLGAQLDVGVPDGLGVSLVGRPLKWMRLHLGAGTDLASAGIRGGATFVPVNYYISPSFTIEGGKMFEGNANSITSKFAVQSSMLERFGYDYANAHLGLELGTPNRFLFFIHGGVSYIVTQVHGLPVNDPTVTFKDPTLKTFGPSAKLGFAVYL